MDRPDVNETEETEETDQAEEPITLEVHDGFIGGDSAWAEGE
jgi:hypothetical protein